MKQSPIKEKESTQINSKRESSEKKKLNCNELEKKNNIENNNLTKKHFYSELKRKFENEINKSPTKFNVTPIRRNSKPILKKTPIKTSTNDIVKKSDKKESKSKCISRNNSEKKKLNSSKKKYLGKKRITFNTDKFIKEFNPKTPVKDVSKGILRISPMERKKNT